MGKPLQQSEAQKPKAQIEEQMGAMINCNDCSFSSENEDISKLHQYTEAEIIERFPPTLKNLTFS